MIGKELSPNNEAVFVVANAKGKTDRLRHRLPGTNTWMSLARITNLDLQ